ncbi:Translation initiation factor IF-2 [Micromonospora saelicesensis]|uniref:FMN-binding protein n=1 Tax=Micromonospora saelicesensis TaxID=285676 RepID=UPI000DC03168|nr:FMN-binding protein [Micromonospora saelicesensis]RAO62264.1 Translation initiation factor IF-2 [Micromonospora saelicesensis]
MRRALLAITGLAASTTALVVFKGSPGTSQVAQNLPTAQPVNPSAPGTDPGALADAPGTDPAGGTPTSSESAKPSTSPKPGKTTARPSGTRTTKAPSAPRTTTKAPQSTTRRVTGNGFENEYGYVQVQIVVSGNRIVEAVALSLPSGGESDIHSGDVRNRYDGRGGEVVQKQNGNLNTVSGATETSNSYKQSLRSAIEQAF